MSAWDETQVHADARRYRLAVNTRRRNHGQGHHLGAGPGASLEFHDHRSYGAGDDLRHLDWGVLARSDQLVIRRYRQEVSPRVDICFDCSVSMSAHAGKWQQALQMTALMMTLAEQAGTQPRLWILADQIHCVQGNGQWRGVLQQCEPQGVAGLSLNPVPQLYPGGERVLISDGLVASGGQQQVRRWGKEAGSLHLVQILSQQEIEPALTGALRLIDVEGGMCDVVVSDDLRVGYKKRFDTHQAEWHKSLRGRGQVATGVVEKGWQYWLNNLVRETIIEVKLP